MTNTKTLNKVLSWVAIICATTLFAMVFMGNYGEHMFHIHEVTTEKTYGICWNYTAIVLIIELIGLAAVVWKLIFCSIPNFKKLGTEPHAIGGLVLDAVLICAFVLLIVIIPLTGSTEQTVEHDSAREEVLNMLSWFSSPLALITSIAGLKIGKNAYKK